MTTWLRDGQVTWVWLFPIVPTSPEIDLAWRTLEEAS